MRNIIIFLIKSGSEVDLFRTQESIKKLKNENLKVHIVDDVCELESCAFNYSRNLLAVVIYAGDILVEEMFTVDYGGEAPTVYQPEYSYKFNSITREIQKNIEMSQTQSFINVMSIRYHASRHFISPIDELQKFIKMNMAVTINCFHWRYLIYLIEEGYFLINIKNVISFENQMINIKHYGQEQVDNFFPKKSWIFEYEHLINIENFGHIYRKKEPSMFDSNNYVSFQTIQQAIDSNGLNKGVRLTSKRLGRRLKNRVITIGSRTEEGRIAEIKQLIRESYVDIKKTLNNSEID